MNNKQIHPAVIERHIRTKAWNEYVVNYFGLTMTKRVTSDHRYIWIRQGSCLLFECWDFQLRPMTNAEMHQKVKKFLEQYAEQLRLFGDFEQDANFKPPQI